MTSLTSVLSAMEGSGDAFSVKVPDDWLQGRTAYGGLLAALCLEAAQRRFADLPPLRSAHFVFVGPATGLLNVSAEVLRRGKSTAFVQSDVAGEAGLAVRSSFCFGDTRSSEISYRQMPAPQAKNWDACPGFLKPHQGPRHLVHFESRIAGGLRPFSQDEPPAYLVWLRHLHDTSSRPGPALLALADALPPPALVLAKQVKAISTMTWSVNFYSPPRRTEGASDWWLSESSARSFDQCYSIQDMRIWDCNGNPVLSGSQTVAIFV